MPRITRARRGAVAFGIIGLSLLAVGIAAGPILQLVSPPRPRADVAAVRHRLALLTVANRAGNIDAANALAGSIAAGIGVDTPAELAFDAKQLTLHIDPRGRELAIAHATGILDALDRSSTPQSPLIDTVARFALVAGALAVAIAVAMLNRIVRRQHNALVVRQMLAELPAEPSRHEGIQPTGHLPDFGRIVAITNVNDS